MDILSTFPGDYGESNGTSMASPHVAGAAALYAATHPGASPAQVKAALLSSRELVALPGDPDGINEGILNFAFAPPSPPPPTVTPTPPTVDYGTQTPPQKHKKKKGKHRKKGQGKKR